MNANIEYCRICNGNDNLECIFSKVYLDLGGSFMESKIVDVLSNLFSQKIDYTFEEEAKICHHCKNLVQATFELKTRLDISINIKTETTNIKNEECLIENNEVYENYIPCVSDYNTCISSEDNDEFSIKDNEIVREEVSHKSPIQTEVSKLTKTKFNQQSPKKDEEKEESVILHNCPLCTLELSALDLRKHIRTHKSLKKYLNIPKISENTLFYTHPRKTVSLINKKEKNIFKCLYCTEELSVENFVAHLDTHNLQNEHKCDKCDRIFRKTSHLAIHQHSHKNDFPHKCNICEKGFVVKKNYEYHLLTHTDIELPYGCKYCQKRFANPLHLQRHIIVHTENISYSQKYRVWKCGTCLRSFVSNKDLLEHFCTGRPSKLSHSTRKLSSRKPGIKYKNDRSKMYSCNMCPKHFTSKSGLYFHVQSKHYGRDRKVLCTVCGKHVINLTYHMKRHNGVKDFNCHLCPKGFYSQKTLQQHLFVHTGQKPYICSSCGKAFNNLNNLQVHERIHAGVKKHLCTVCGKAFLESSYLKKHMKIHQVSIKKNYVDIKLESDAGVELRC